MKWRRWIDAAIELLYPSRANCMGCGSLIGADEGWLCDACWEWLVPMREISDWICPRCGRALLHDTNCRACERWPKDALDGAWIAYAYQRPIDRMIRRLKYDGVRCLAQWMGTQMAELYLAGGRPSVDVVMAVPMHKRRVRQRGFNHAELLARTFAEAAQMPFDQALSRVRHTKQQARLGLQQRESNMRGAFVADDSVKGRRILLVDDVLTTGTTAIYCALALKQAGAKCVYVATLSGVMER